LKNRPDGIARTESARYPTGSALAIRSIESKKGDLLACTGTVNGTVAGHISAQLRDGEDTPVSTTKGSGLDKEAIGARDARR
jgi:hypothetical protein